MEDAGVTIPLSWFLSTIALLSGVIGMMAREFLKLQNERIVEANKRSQEIREDTERVVTTLNDNTGALNRLTDAITGGG